LAVVPKWIFKKNNMTFGAFSRLFALLAKEARLYRRQADRGPGAETSLDYPQMAEDAREPSWPSVRGSVFAVDGAADSGREFG
jgi:hypothetical protein